MFILHHYSMSPFSEKIRLMFGYAGLAWQSLPCPEMPPRPTVDPLSGGYRRIPIAQVGADIFCDSRLISAEIAREHAEGEFEKYRVIQDRLFRSDFDTFAALEKREEDTGDE